MPLERPTLAEFVLDRITLGVVVVDRGQRVVAWNRFMATHTGRAADEVVGRDLFECFPDLPRGWLSKKLEAVFLLGSYAFTTWRERPYLFHMPHNRPITGGVDSMRQDCILFPVLGEAGNVDYVCVSVGDVTDTAITEERLHEALHKIEILSSYDSLTGLLNRRVMQERLETEVARARRYSAPLALILFDFDHFKNVNDSYGHLCGDRVLQEVAKKVLKVVREVDVAARYGGEEYALVLPHTTLSGARKVAERLRRIVETEPVSFAGQEIRVTISAGVTALQTTTADSYALLGEADKALYVAKERGRNQVACSPDI